MKLLFIDQHFGGTKTGGAYKSNFAIINKLMDDPFFQIRVLARETKTFFTKNLRVKKIKPHLTLPKEGLNTLIKFLRVNQYFSIFPILLEIKRYKPDVILVQRDMTFSAIIAGFLTKTPVINVIRDIYGFCPKYINVKNFKECCERILERKECWRCIDRWKKLRVHLLDKPRGFEHSLLAELYSLFYKFRYFLIKFYTFFMKYTYLNIIASPMMQKIIEPKAKTNRFLVSNITPIQPDDTNEIKKIPQKILNKIDDFKHTLLFVIPRNEGGSKGYPFVKELIEKLPGSFLFVIVGTIIDELKQYNNVINLDKVPSQILSAYYKMADITLVPSLGTEAFGRVILESLFNLTPAIISPQCGAKYLFTDKNYVKILELNLSLWVEGIKDFIQNPAKINEKEIKKLKNQFSPSNTTDKLIKIMRFISKNEKY